MTINKFSIILCVIAWCLISIKYVNSEFNSSQHQQYKLPNPTVRNLDISPSPSSSSYNFGNRLATGGKYRSSYYYPKSVKTATPSPGGANPVWVVWGRQGTPFEDSNNYQPSDFQQFGISGASVDEPPSNYYYGNGNPYGNSIVNPYQDELASYPQGWSWTRADTDGSEELTEDDIDIMTANQLQGLVKTRRTGIESLGGLLSLKGLKLSALGFFYLFRGVVMIAWKFLPWIFLVAVAFMFIPVPIITIPASAGRSSGLINLNMTEVTNAVSGLVHQVEQNQQCAERLACELRRGIRETWIQPPLKLLIYNYQSKLPTGFQRMAKAYLQRKKCKLYKCFVYNETLK